MSARSSIKITPRGKEPLVQVFDVNLKDKTYKDIQSAQQLAALIMVEAMKPTAIKGAKIYGSRHDPRRWISARRHRRDVAG